jgi:hypothetical protein
MPEYRMTPPAKMTIPKAIESNPYGEGGGYNFYSGDWETRKQTLYERLLEALSKLGERPPSEQEFSEYYDSTEKVPGGVQAGSGYAPPAEAKGEQDWRVFAPARSQEGIDLRREKEAASEKSWQRLLESLKAKTPISGNEPLPPPSGYMDSSKEPRPEDFDRNSDYIEAYSKWISRSSP